MAHSDTHMRMHTQGHTFKGTQKDTETHSENHTYRNTLRYIHKDTDTHINVQRPTNILKDMQTQRCSYAHINTAT